MNPLYPATVILILALLLFYQLIIKPNQDAKNKIKQEAEERKKIDRLLSQTFPKINSIGYEDFAETEMSATSL